MLVRWKYVMMLSKTSNATSIVREIILTGTASGLFAAVYMEIDYVSSVVAPEQ
jgi:hypothetical protein